MLGERNVLIVDDDAAVRLLIRSVLAAGARWHVAKRDITSQLVHVLAVL